MTPETQTPQKKAAPSAALVAVVCAVVYIVFKYLVKIKVSSFISGLAMVWLVYAIVELLLGALKKRADQKKAQNQPGAADAIATASAMIASIAKYAAVIITVLWLLTAAGVDTTTILAAAGIVSLVVGFAAQSLIEDVITGIFILFEGQYKIGDILVLGDFRGTVIDIGVRTTTIEDAGGNRKIVNNSDIRNVQNRSRNESKAVCTIAISYDENLERVEAVLAKALPEIYEECKDVFESVPSYNGIEEFQDSGILLHFSVTVAEQNIFKAKRVLNRQLKLLFDREHIEIPFPQVVVHRAQD